MLLDSNHEIVSDFHDRNLNTGFRSNNSNHHEHIFNFKMAFLTRKYHNQGPVTVLHCTVLGIIIPILLFIKIRLPIITMFSLNSKHKTFSSFHEHRVYSRFKKTGTTVLRRLFQMKSLEEKTTFLSFLLRAAHIH